MATNNVYIKLESSCWLKKYAKNSFLFAIQQEICVIFDEKTGKISKTFVRYN